MVIIYFSDRYRTIKQNSDISFTGDFCIENQFIKENEIFNILESINDHEELKDKLKQYNGFYAFVLRINNGEKYFAVVDKIRSIPLFYGVNENNCYISNDCDWVRQQIADASIDPICEKEFLMTGFVTGNNTLYRGIKQLRAGEYLCISKNLNKDNDLVKYTLNTYRYYKFCHDEPKEHFTKQEYIDKLDSEVTKIIKRLIAYADGNQIVLPLSSGRDSKLIALKLKQLGYSNVLCFSYGIKNNYEIEGSRKIAAMLNFRWTVVEHSSELWKKWFNSPERESFYKMSFNNASLPNMQDWPALWELTQKGLIDKKAIIVPGHTGDFISGGHIPESAFPTKKASNRDLIKSIKTKHYFLTWDPDLNLPFWEKRILELFDTKTSVENGYEFANLSEQWNWQERQSKFIVNCARIYEFWGYNWWFPFWDNEFMLFWEKVPLIYRKDKTMYNEYVDKITYDMIGVSVSKSPKKIKKNLIKELCKLVLNKTPFVYFNRKRVSKKNLNEINNLLGVLGAFSDDFIVRNKKKLATINGLFAIYIIEKIRKSG